MREYTILNKQRLLKELDECGYKIRSSIEVDSNNIHKVRSLITWQEIKGYIEKSIEIRAFPDDTFLNTYDIYNKNGSNILRLLVEV